MRLGYAASADAPAPVMVQAARNAEAAGFHDIWLPEDYCERGVFSVAGAVAAVTESIRVGIGVINPWTRHPALIAMEAGALDELAPGRLILGLGASNERWMSDWLGIPFRAPLSRTRDAIGIVRDLLAGHRVERSFHGIDVATELSFRPPTESLPIYLGAKGGRALAVAGEHADGVLLSILSAPRYISWARDQIGNPSVPIGCYVLFACGNDSAEVRAQVRPTVAKYLGMHGDHAITRVAGLDPELGRRFREHLLRGEPATHLVTDQILDTFTATGDPDQVLEALERFRDAGSDALVLVGAPDSSPEETLHAGRLAAEAGIATG